MSEIKTWRERMAQPGAHRFSRLACADAEIAELRAAKAADDKRLEWLRVNMDSAITRENIDQAIQGANKTRQPSE